MSDRALASRVAFAVLAAVVVLGGCGGIQARKERADRIIHSVDKAVTAGSAQMSVSVNVRLRLQGADRVAATGTAGSISTTSGGQAGPSAGPTAAAVSAAANPRNTFTAVADLGRDRVAYLAPDASGSVAASRIYAGTTIYGRRLATGDATTQPRPWVRLDLKSIDPDDINTGDVLLAGAIRRIGETKQGFENPLFLLKLLKGALSGSVKVVGTEQVRGVPTTHYKLNIDREKAFRHDTEKVQHAYETIFRSMFATRKVFPAEVWLDDQGLPRRYVVTLKSRMRHESLADLRVSVEAFDIGKPVTIVLPAKKATAQVDTLENLTQTIMGGGA